MTQVAEHKTDDATCVSKAYDALTEFQGAYHQAQTIARGISARISAEPASIFKLYAKEHGDALRNIIANPWAGVTILTPTLNRLASDIKTKVLEIENAPFVVAGLIDINKLEELHINHIPWLKRQFRLLLGKNKHGEKAVAKGTAIQHLQVAINHLNNISTHKLATNAYKEDREIINKLTEIVRRIEATTEVRSLEKIHEIGTELRRVKYNLNPKDKDQSSSGKSGEADKGRSSHG